MEGIPESGQLILFQNDYATQPKIGANILERNLSHRKPDSWGKRISAAFQNGSEFHTKTFMVKFFVECMD